MKEMTAKNARAGQMAQFVLEDMGSIPGTHRAAHNCDLLAFKNTHDRRHPRHLADSGAAAIGAPLPRSPGRGLNPGKAEPGKPTRPYSPLHRVRPTEHAQRRGRARRGGSACTLRSPGFSASRGWGQGAGRRTQPRGGENPFPPSRLACPRAPPARHAHAVAPRRARPRFPLPRRPWWIPTLGVSPGNASLGPRREVSFGEADWGGGRGPITFASQARPYHLIMSLTVIFTNCILAVTAVCQKLCQVFPSV